MTEYAADINAPCAYPPASLENTFGEWMAKNEKPSCASPKLKVCARDLLLNGGVEESFKGEDRILINSPKVATTISSQR
ncbi:hypothetical protein ACNKHS_21530 [Shigella flexneri]